MTPFSELIQQGSSHAWLFIPSAILLGVLHGLEPGHSKTMMAAFIVAIKGTIYQAILLGLTAAFSHTLIVWLVAIIGLQFSSKWNAETTEPYFQLISAVLIIGIALWMLARTWKENTLRKKIELGEHEHEHNCHSHGAELKKVNTGRGIASIEIFEEIIIEIERPLGEKQVFAFKKLGKYFESINEIPEPHEFMARLKLTHHDHTHDYDVEFTEQGHHHVHVEYSGLDVSSPGYQDAHELAHANDIRRRFANQNVTTKQIILFGLTGGLIPCPAAITVLLLCLQLKEFTLGASLVLCFSAGLAVTMVASGVIAAVSMKHISKRWTGFSSFISRAPYFSSIMIICIGIYVGYHGFLGIYSLKI
jgi:nickel/cobalt transporter (NicO) family protein